MSRARAQDAAGRGSDEEALGRRTGTKKVPEKVKKVLDKENPMPYNKKARRKGNAPAGAHIENFIV